MEKIDFNKLTKVLPDNPGLMGRDEYLNSAVIIPLFRKNKEYYLLFEKRADGIRQGGEICFPGGEYDPDKDSDFVNTAVRETREELGLSGEKINVLGRLDTFVGPMGVTVEPFLALLEIDDLNELRIDPSEVGKVVTYPLAYFLNTEPEIFEVKVETKPYYYNNDGVKIDLLPVKKLGLPKRYEKAWGGKNHKVYYFKPDQEIIWGITARLLLDLIRLLKEADSL